MKKEYVSPEVEVFQFDVADRVMDNTGCEYYDAGDLPSSDECIVDGLDIPSCITDGLGTSALV